jgi:hypothetical protein
VYLETNLDHSILKLFVEEHLLPVGEFLIAYLNMLKEFLVSFKLEKAVEEYHLDIRLLLQKLHSARFQQGHSRGIDSFSHFYLNVWLMVDLYVLNNSPYFAPY